MSFHINIDRLRFQQLMRLLPVLFVLNAPCISAAISTYSCQITSSGFSSLYPGKGFSINPVGGMVSFHLGFGQVLHNYTVTSDNQTGADTVISYINGSGVLRDQLSGYVYIKDFYGSANIYAKGHASSSYGYGNNFAGETNLVMTPYPDTGMAVSVSGEMMRGLRRQSGLPPGYLNINIIIY